jgi:hypothetical protein
VRSSSSHPRYFMPFPVSQETSQPLLPPGEHAVTFTFAHTNRNVSTGKREMFHVCLRMQGPSCSDLTVTAAINEFWNPSEIIQSRKLVWSPLVHTWKNPLLAWRTDSGEKIIGIQFNPIEVQMPDRSQGSVICRAMEILLYGSFYDSLRSNSQSTLTLPEGSLPEMLCYRDNFSKARNKCHRYKNSVQNSLEPYYPAVIVYARSYAKLECVDRYRLKYTILYLIQSTMLDK